MASVGAMVNHSGCRAASAQLTMRARGLRLWVLRAFSLATRMAAAPSLILEALAAVMVPSGLKAGLRAGILSNFASARLFRLL